MQATLEDGTDDSSCEPASAAGPAAQLRSWLSRDTAALRQQPPSAVDDGKAPTVILMPNGQVALAQRLSYSDAQDGAVGKDASLSRRDKQCSDTGGGIDDTSRVGDQDGVVAARVAGAVEDLRQLREQVAAVIAARHARHIAETSARLAPVLAAAPQAGSRPSTVGAIPAGHHGGQQQPPQAAQQPQQQQRQQQQEQLEPSVQPGWQTRWSGWRSALGLRRPVVQPDVELQAQLQGHVPAAAAFPASQPSGLATLPPS